MSTHEVTFYQAKCDGCGYIESDYGEYSAWMHDDVGMMGVDDMGWAVAFGTDSRDLCPACQHCEVCGKQGYEIDDHLVCDVHEDHFDA